MVRELQTIRESIFAAMQEQSEYRHVEPGEARAMIDACVHLGRLDPGQWAPEALVVAHTEDGLPPPDDYEFWQRVAEIASRRGCRVRSSDVTHFTVGFFQDVRIPADVAEWIERAAAEAQENTRFRLEAALNSDNISSPIKQIFFVCWEALRASLRSDLAPGDHELPRHRLYPQFPITSPEGEEYLLDFAVMRFDAAAYRRRVVEWERRQDSYSDGNWVADPYPKERDSECSVNVKVAIECDSYRHHVTELSPTDFEYQKRRERFLQADGWRVFPLELRFPAYDEMRLAKEEGDGALSAAPREAGALRPHAGSVLPRPLDDRFASLPPVSGHMAREVT